MSLVWIFFEGNMWWWITWECAWNITGLERCLLRFSHFYIFSDSGFTSIYRILWARYNSDRFKLRLNWLGSGNWSWSWCGWKWSWFRNFRFIECVLCGLNWILVRWWEYSFKPWLRLRFHG